MSKILRFDKKKPNDGRDVEPVIGLTVVRAAIDRTLLELSKRFSFLEDEMVRADIGNAIHTSIVGVLEKYMTQKDFNGKTITHGNEK